MKAKKQRYRVLSSLLVFFLANILSISAQTYKEAIERSDQLFAAIGVGTPGASVTVSKQGKVIYNNYFGMADLEHSAPVTENTLFEAGSVSKQFTATAILLLAQDGKLQLDDNVQKYIPELPTYRHPVTIRHLLNHTSGLKDWGALAALGGWPRGTRVYTNQMALAYIIKQPTLNNRPGQEYIYSNSNYTLLTLIVERVSGQRLDVFTQERIFNPLGMEKTRWRTDYQEVVTDRANGYRKRGHSFVLNMPFENTYGHAALLTTTNDLDTWNTSWKNSPLGGESLLRLRTQQGVLNNGDTINYAAGVRIDEINGRVAVQHSGATAGYRAYLTYFPEEELSVVFLSNDAGSLTQGVHQELLNIWTGHPVQKSLTSTNKMNPRPAYELDRLQAQAFIGTYTSQECDGYFDVLLDQSNLVMRNASADSRILTPRSDSTFSLAGGGTVRFVTDAHHQVMGCYITVSRARHVWFKREGYNNQQEIQRLPNDLEPRQELLEQ